MLTLKKTTSTPPILKKLKTLSFFSGIGGIELGLQEYIDLCGMCEMDPFNLEILKRHYPEVTLYDNIDNFPLSSSSFLETDLIIAGSPFQECNKTDPKSHRFKGKSISLVWKLLEIVDSYQPRFLFLENSSNLVNNVLYDIIQRLDLLGYDSRWITLSSTKVGALHRRNKFFLLACRRAHKISKPSNPHLITHCHTRNLIPLPSNLESLLSDNHLWREEPDISRVTASYPPSSRIKNRIRSIGNAVIPHQARQAFRLLLMLNISSTTRNQSLEQSQTLSLVETLEYSWKDSQKYLIPIDVYMTRPDSSGILMNDRYYKFPTFPTKCFNTPVYPPTIQRFQSTHSIPTPTSMEYIIRTHTKKSCPGANKSISLNQYLAMFPTRNTSLPEITHDGYLVDKTLLLETKIPNPQWLEWLMGFPLDWTD